MYSKRGSRYRCFLHGEQATHGCVIECPVCAHMGFLETFGDKGAQEEFDRNWRTSPFNQPWDPDRLDLEA